MENEEILTIPNIITLLRMLLIPFFILSLVYNKTEIAILLFGAIAMGDALDGLSARIMKQKTKIGALLDSTTDWLAILSTLITFLFIKIQYLPIWIIVILLIPAVIGIIAKGVYVRKGRKTSPTIIGKITIAFAYITTISFLINFEYKNFFLIGIILLAYTTLITYIAKDVKLFIK